MESKKRMAGKVPFFLMLVLVLGASVLTGCSSGKESGGVQQGTVRGSGGASPKGRYVEEMMDLPFDSSKESLRNIAITPEGQLTILTDDLTSDGSSRIYRQRDSGEWETDDTLPKQLPKGSTLVNMAYAGSDTYFLARDEAGYFVGKAGDAKNGWQAARYDDTLFKQEKRGTATCIFAESDGTVLISFMEGQTIVYNPDSGQTLSLYQKTRNSSRNTSCTLIGDTYITAGDRDFTMYSTKSGEELGAVPYQTGASDVNGSLASTGEQDLYLCNPAGIHHITPGGTVWETVVDGTLNSLSLPGNAIWRLCVGTDNDFFVLFEGADYETSLAHYVYDPDVPSVPAETLTVYGIGLEEKRLVSEGAGRFQMENPDVRVEMLDGRKQMAGMKDADIIRAVNTELLNGKGADVMVLDGLPAQAYIEKGILEDMSGALKPLKDEWYRNLVGSFTQESGAVYEMPLRILFPIVYGNDSAAKSFSGLEALWEYENSQDAGAVRGKAVYENILRQLSFLYYNELWDKNDGKLNEEAVKLLLRTVMQTGKDCGAKPVFDESEDDGYGKKYNQISENGFTGPDWLELAEGKTEVSLELPESMEDMSIPSVVMKDNGYQLYSVNSNFYPVERIGINKNSEKKELAEKFVRFLLSEKIQSEDVKDGFPVSPAGAQGWQKRKENIAFGGGSIDDGTFLEGDYPDEEGKKEILGFLPTLQNPVIPDSSVITILTGEAAGLFEGAEDLEAAVKKIENKVTLYQEEME